MQNLALGADPEATRHPWLRTPAASITGPNWLMTWSTSRGRGLPLQRFGKIVGALAQLVEQAGILDGDDRLRRKNFVSSSICFPR